MFTTELELKTPAQLHPGDPRNRRYFSSAPSRTFLVEPSQCTSSPLPPLPHPFPPPLPHALVESSVGNISEFTGSNPHSAGKYMSLPLTHLKVQDSPSADWGHISLSENKSPSVSPPFDVVYPHMNCTISSYEA
jgi:hypothetical protein